jgi:polysaccharide biosynthesis/export protein
MGQDGLRRPEIDRRERGRWSKSLQLQGLASRRRKFLQLAVFTPPPGRFSLRRVPPTVRPRRPSHPPPTSMRRLFLLAAALLAFAHPSAGNAQNADSAFIRPGDVVRLVVFRQPELSGDFPVSSDGTLQHPLLSEVRVVGVSRGMIRERLREVISRYARDPSFVFDFLYRVTVTGEVRLPNLLTLSPETTIGQAVASAGGITEFGRLDRVHLIRDGREQLLNLQAPDPAVAAMRIHSGDQIRVTRRSNVLRDFLGPFAAIVGAIAALASVAGVN